MMPFQHETPDVQILKLSPGLRKSEGGNRKKQIIRKLMTVCQNTAATRELLIA